MRPLIWAGASLDRAAIRIMERVMSRGGKRLPADDPAAALAEATAHYRRPDVRARYFAAPARVQFREHRTAQRLGPLEVVDLSWQSGYQPTHEGYRWRYLAYRENQTAIARHYRLPDHGRAPDGSDRARRRPTILCLHGWGGGSFRLEHLAFGVPFLARLGLDVVLVQLPFHGQRSPRGIPSGLKFPSTHVVRMNEAFGHALADLRSLVAWLRERGAPEVGVMGMSLGGYTAALLASAEPLDFAVPMIPVASFAEVMWSHGEGRPARARAEAAGISGQALRAAFEIHAPLERPCLVRHDRRFIIAGLGDRIAPPEQAEWLARHWGHPRMHWYPGGHLAQFGRRETFGELASFLAEAGVIAQKPRKRAA